MNKLYVLIEHPESKIIVNEIENNEWEQCVIANSISNKPNAYLVPIDIASKYFKVDVPEPTQEELEDIQQFIDKATIEDLQKVIDTYILSEEELSNYSKRLTFKNP